MRADGLLERWIRFNGVGALGVGVQLAVLAWLIRGIDLNYLGATVIAVEAAVLHNFYWHERWTWRDRPSGSAMSFLKRAVRFHLLNGAISLTGNLLLMRILTGALNLDPLAGNIIAIIACSIMNFGASELYVFKRTALAAAFVLAVHSVAAADTGPAAVSSGEMLAVDLQAQTVQAWNKYEERVDGRYEAAAPAGTPFFALDAFGSQDWRSTASQGGIALSRIERARPGDAEISVPDGKIHHWAGAIFVPGTTVAAVLDRLSRLAGDEAKYYEDVIASKRLSKDGDRYRIFLKLRRSKVITVTYNTEHAVAYRRLGATRATARSVSTRIAELDDAGTPREREKTVGSDSGYLWRLNAYWRYEAVGNGVLIECESVSLSRGVPMLLRPFISGVVEGLAKESLERTLVGLRSYLTKS
ncbi:MAG: GtrA family protein [Vicinamibacterales bacterium]